MPGKGGACLVPQGGNPGRGREALSAIRPAGNGQSLLRTRGAGERRHSRGVRQVGRNQRTPREAGGSNSTRRTGVETGRFLSSSAACPCAARSVFWPVGGSRKPRARVGERRHQRSLVGGMLV